MHLLSALVGYLFGCINGSQIVGKIKKIDIKNSGVKNAGASNTTLLLGWKYGIIVLLIDVAKAIIPILYLKNITSDITLLFIMGAFVIIGHNYPITMNFKGGKGTASAIGMFFAIDWKIGLISLLVLVLFALATNYLVMGVFAFYVTFTLLTMVMIDLFTGLIVMALTILSSIKHQENFERIQAGTETKITSLFKKKVEN